MRTVMYIFLNKGLGMSTGKSAAQVAHAAVEAFRVSDTRLVEEWYVGGHYTKVIMEAEDEQHLHAIKYYVEKRGFKTELIVDEGRSEVRPHTATALGVEIVDKDDPHVTRTFESFKTYRDRPSRPDPDPMTKRRWFG